MFENRLRCEFLKAQGVVHGLAGGSVIEIDEGWDTGRGVLLQNPSPSAEAGAGIFTVVVGATVQAGIEEGGGEFVGCGGGSVIGPAQGDPVSAE